MILIICGNLRKLTINTNETFYKSNSFNSCSKLTDFIIKVKCEEITNKNDFKCEEAFANCESHISNKSNQLNHIENGVFKRCKKLKEIKLIVIEDHIENETFLNCSDLSDVKLSTKSKSIRDFAFSGCSQIKESIIPSLFQSIGKSAFSDCTKLETVILPSAIQQNPDEAFKGCTSLTQISTNKFKVSNEISTIIIPMNVNSILHKVFFQVVQILFKFILKLIKQNVKMIHLNGALTQKIYIFKLQKKQKILKNLKIILILLAILNLS